MQPREFSDEDIDRLIHMAKNNPEELRGRVARAVGNLETGKILAAGRVPHTEALEDRHGKMRRGSITMPIPEHMKPLADPVQRTELQRVASLSKRLVDHYRKYGNIPLDSPFMRELQVECAKAGRVDISAEDLRRLAASILERAEKDNKVSEKQRQVAEVDRKLREGSADAFAVDPRLNRQQRRAVERMLRKAK